MGMSASQMRYCMISGRKSDVEFQGQQINQQRTTLATQSSAYNTQLLDLDVPTPPSSDAYSKTSYTYTSNGETRTVSGTQYKASAYTVNGKSYDAGTYIVNYTTGTTTSKGKSSGTSTFSSTTAAGVTTYKTNAGTVLEKAITNPTDPDYDATDASNLSLVCQDCGIKDASGKSYGDAGYVMPTFYKYTSNGDTKYTTENDLIASANTTTPISTYYVDDKASVTESATMPGASVEWNDSGRMTSITDADGNEYTLSVTSSDDTAAYNDAFNEYNYKKAEYDQSIDNINSKIDIIESQDKKLELKLQDLDTQQQALSTEMDSVKKVIDKNIENSFKAFA